MSRIYAKLKSISVKQWVIALLACMLTLMLTAFVLTSQWVKAAIIGAAFLLYISVVCILILRQLEYRLSPGVLGGTVTAFVGSSSMSPTANKGSKGKNSRLVLRESWGAVGFYAELNARKSKYLGKQIVRGRYVDGRDVLAHVVTKGRMGIVQLRDLLDAYRAPAKKKPL